jgi:hypothetical protein
VPGGRYSLIPTHVSRQKKPSSRKTGSYSDWCYSWDGGHVRGVDMFRVRDGKVAEKLSYVKG